MTLKYLKCAISINATGFGRVQNLQIHFDLCTPCTHLTASCALDPGLESLLSYLSTQDLFRENCDIKLKLRLVGLILEFEVLSRS